MAQDAPLTAQKESSLLIREADTCYPLWLDALYSRNDVSMLPLHQRSSMCHFAWRLMDFPVSCCNPSPRGLSTGCKLDPFLRSCCVKTFSQTCKFHSGQLWAWYQTISFIWNITTEIIVFLPKMKISYFFSLSHWGGKVLLPLTHFLEEKLWPWRRKAREKVCTNKYRL